MKQTTMMWLFMIRMDNPSIEGPFTSHEARVKRAREIWHDSIADHVSGDCIHRLDIDAAGRPTTAPFEEDLDIDDDGEEA